jgi:hypothetical protein
MPRHLSRRKPTAYDRRCIEQGQILVRRANGIVYCRERTATTRDEKEEHRAFLMSQTVKRLKQYIVSKGLSGYSKLRKEQLVRMILHYVDVETGEVIYRTSMRH